MKHEKYIYIDVGYIGKHGLFIVCVLSDNKTMLFDEFPAFLFLYGHNSQIIVINIICEIMILHNCLRSLSTKHIIITRLSLNTKENISHLFLPLFKWPLLNGYKPFNNARFKERNQHTATSFNEYHLHTDIKLTELNNTLTKRSSITIMCILYRTLKNSQLISNNSQRMYVRMPACHRLVFWNDTCMWLPWCVFFVCLFFLARIFLSTYFIFISYSV